MTAFDSAVLLFRLRAKFPTFRDVPFGNRSLFENVEDILQIKEVILFVECLLPFRRDSGSVRDILLIFAAIVGIVSGCATALDAAISKPLEKQFNAIQRGNDELKESNLLLIINMDKKLDESKKDMDRKLDENKKDIKGMDKKLDLILHQKVWWFQR